MASKKKVTETSLVPWTEKFAKYAKQTVAQAKNISTGGIGVKFGHGTIEIGGNKVPGGRLECVIIGSCFMNAWNKSAYDPNNTQPPDCYAFADVREEDDDDPTSTINGTAVTLEAAQENPEKLEMRPMPQSPLKQSDLCRDCPQNIMGSATTGKGKACANTVRLGLITAQDAKKGADAAKAEIATAKVSYTNTKHWRKYVEELNEEYHRPPWSVVTEISSHHDDKTQIRLEFKLVETIDDDEVLQALEKRYLKIQGVLQQPFSVAAEKEEAPVKKAAANRKFAPQQAVKKGRK